MYIKHDYHLFFKLTFDDRFLIFGFFLNLDCGKKKLP